MTPFFLYFVLLSLVSLVTMKLLFQTRRFKNIPPGPRYLPMIGNLHQLKQPLHRTMQSLAKKYGRIYSLRLGYRYAVVVTSQSLVQECFTKNDIVLANRPYFLIDKYVAYNNSIVSVAPYGDHWRNLRRILTLEVLSSHRLNNFLDIRRDEIMKCIHKLARDSCKDFAQVKLKARFSEMAFNNAMRMISGKIYYGDDSEVTDVEEARRFREIIEEMTSLGGVNNPGDFVRIVRWFDFDSLEKRLKIISKKSDTFLQGLLDEHRHQLQNTNTMIDHLLTLQKSQPEYYSDQIIKGIILTMLLAGTDTSSITLEWAMSNLLNQPEILEKAKKELDTQIGQDRLIDEPDVSKLPYLQGIVYETFRLHPAAPLLLPHLSSDYCTIGGYDIPPDTMVLINAWAIHRDPEVWSDPTCFKPERFEKEGEANKLLIFGIGRRVCPGANLAQRIVTLALGLVIQCFEWKRTTEEEIDLTEGKGLTMPKKIKLEAMCKVRQPWATTFSNF